MMRIRSKDLETGSVNARVLGVNAVTGRALAPGSVGRGQIIGGTIGPDELEAGGVTAPKVGDGAIIARHILDGTIEVAKFAESLRPVQLVDTLPALPDPNYPPDVAIVFVKGEGKLYRNVAGVWTAKVPVVDLDGQITETQIADGSISTPKLIAGSVTTEVLAANSVTADQLAANSVYAGTIQAGAVSTDELAANAISADKIKANAVGATQLAAIFLEVGKYIRSTVYTPGSVGWAIDADGNVEFNSATIRNGVYVGGTITAATFQTATSGARVRITSGADGVTFFNSSEQQSTLRLGITDGLETSGSLRLGGIVTNGILYCGAVNGRDGWILRTDGGITGGHSIRFGSTAAAVGTTGQAAWMHMAARAYFRQTENGGSNNGLVDCGTLFYDTLTQKSSRHLKRNIAPLRRDALADLAGLKVCEFEYRHAPGAVRLGVIADEAPEWAVQHHDADVGLDEEGNEFVMSPAISTIDTTAVMWEAVAALQQLAGRVAVLEGAA